MEGHDIAVITPQRVGDSQVVNFDDDIPGPMA